MKKRQLKGKGGQNASSTDAEGLGLKFNPALNDYITRSFTKCRGRPNYEKEMTELLKMITDHSKALGDLETRDWAAYPLPLLSYERLNMMNVTGAGYPAGQYPGTSMAGP